MTGSAVQRLVLGPEEGEYSQIGPFGVRWLIDADTGGGFSLVEHPIAARALAAPMHVHKHEDEYSYVLEGEVGVQVGDEVAIANPGDLVFKPRGVWHAFWNAGDAPARVLEIISPAGFERFFAELAPIVEEAGGLQEAGPKVAELQARYGVEMDFASAERLVREHGLVGSRDS